MISLFFGEVFINEYSACSRVKEHIGFNGSELLVCSWVGRHIDSFSTWATSTDETTKTVGADADSGHQSKNSHYQ